MQNTSERIFVSCRTGSGDLAPFEFDNLGSILANLPGMSDIRIQYSGGNLTLSWLLLCEKRADLGQWLYRHQDYYGTMQGVVFDNQAQADGFTLALDQMRMWQRLGGTYAKVDNK